MGATHHADCTPGEVVEARQGFRSFDLYRAEGQQMRSVAFLIIALSGLGAGIVADPRRTKVRHLLQDDER